MRSADTIIDARWIVPIEPAGVVFENYSVAIANGELLTLTPTAEIDALFSTKERVALPDHVLLPGLINLHTHAAMTLMRGLADDTSLMDWLNNHIWPVETRMVSPAFVRDGTLLACAEMLRGGITCFNDMYFFAEDAAQAAIAAGMRAAIGIIVLDMPSPYAADAQDYLAKGLALRDAMRDESLLSFTMAPHAPYTVSNAALERVALYAAELDLPVHIHLHETATEVSEGAIQHGVRPLERLRQVGLLSPGLIGVHGVHLDVHEIELLAHHGCSIAHCATSNLKLSSGIAPVSAMLYAGLNVGLGTDGAASNNRLDILGEMRLAALLAKGMSGDPTAISAHTALNMATLAGARALGLDQKIGSIIPGKRADLTAIELSSIELTPCYDPASHIAYAAGREHVTHVWVDGTLQVENRRLVHLDSRELQSKAAHWTRKIVS